MEAGRAFAFLNHCCWIRLFVLLSILAISRSDLDCVYTVYVKTGSIIKGGTDSIITLTLYDTNGVGVRIRNLEAWGGLMGKDYNYFERGNLDIFSGRGPCLTAPVCAMNLTSDGSGSHHGWYCKYVKVTTTGVRESCAQQLFTVEQWLATDTSPYELTAIRNNCVKRPPSPPALLINLLLLPYLIYKRECPIVAFLSNHVVVRSFLVTWG